MRSPTRFAAASLLALAALLVVTSPALAQDSGDVEWKAPRKNGHTFSSIEGVPDAFVRSFIRTNLGVLREHWSTIGKALEAADQLDDGVMERIEGILGNRPPEPESW